MRKFKWMSLREGRCAWHVLLISTKWVTNVFTVRFISSVLFSPLLCYTLEHFSSPDAASKWNVQGKYREPTRRRRRKGRVQECKLKHFILTINFFSAVVCFSSFTLSNASCSGKSGNKIGFAFECEIYFNERRGSSPRSFHAVICWARNNNNFRDLSSHKRMFFFIRRRHSEWKCVHLRRMANYRRLNYWMISVKCEEKTYCFCLSTIASLSPFTCDIAENNKLHFTPTRLNLQFQWIEAKKKRKKVYT